MSFAEDFGNRSEAISESASNPDLSDSMITSKFDTRYELLTCFTKPPQFTEASVYNRSQEMLVVTPKSLWGLFDLWGKGETANFISSAARDEIQSSSAFISLLRSTKKYIVFAFKFTFSKLFVFLFSLVCFLYLDVKVNFSSLIPSVVESNRDFLVFYLCFPLKLLIISIVLYSYTSYVFQDESIKKLIKLSEQNQQSRLAAQIDSTISSGSGGQDSHNHGQSHNASLPITSTYLLNRNRNVLTMKDVPVSLINVAVVGVKLTFTKSSSNGGDFSLVSLSSRSNSNINANHNNNSNINNFNSNSNGNKANYYNSHSDATSHAADGMNKYNGTPIHVRPGVKDDHAILLFNFQIKFQEVCHYLYRSYEDCAVLYLHLKRTNDKKNIPKLASQRKLIKRQIVNDLRRNRHLYGTLDLIHKDKELIKSEHKGVNLEEKHLLYWQLQQCEVISFVRQVMSKEKLSSDSKLREFLGLPAISISHSLDPNFTSRLASNNDNNSYSNNNNSNNNNNNNNNNNSSSSSSNSIAAAVVRSKFGSSMNDQSVLEVTLSRKNLEFHKEIYSTSPSEVNTSTLFTPDFGPPVPEVPINLDALSDASSAFPMTNQLRSIGGSVSNLNPNYNPNPEGVTTAHNGSREYKDIKWRGNTTETLVFEDLSRECRDMFYDPSYPKKLHQFKVRGKYYNADKKKIDADAPIGRCVLVETIEVEADHADNPTIPVPLEYQASVVPPQKKRDPKADRYDHIASKGRIARRIHVMRNFLVDKPFVHVLNLQVPGTPPVSIVCYILIPRRFIDAEVDVGTFDLHHHHHLLHSQQQQPPSPTNSNYVVSSSSSSSLDFTDEELAAKKLLNSYLKIGNEHDRLEAWGIETESDRDHAASMMNNSSDAAVAASSQDPASVEDLDNNNRHSFDVSPFIYGNSDDESEDSEESCDSESEKSTVGSISSTVKNRFFTWSNRSKGGGGSSNNNDDESVSSKSGKKRSGYKKSHSTSDVELDHNNNDEKKQGFFNPFKWIAKRISNKKGMPIVKSESLVGKDGGGGGDSDSDMHSEASTGHSSVGSSKSAGSRKGGAVKESQSLNVIDTKQHIMQNSSNSSLFAVDPNHNSNSNSNSIDRNGYSNNNNGESSPKASTPSGGSSNVGLSLSPPSKFGLSIDSFEAHAGDQPSSPGRKTTTTTPDRSVVTTATANNNSNNNNNSSKNTNTNNANFTGAKSSKPKTINFSPTGGLVSGDVTFASPWEPGGYPPEYFTNKRFKLIPTITDGPWVVKQAVGTSSTPVLLAKRVAQRYFSGPGYMETDVDIGSSGIAAQIVGLCRGYANAFVCYMGVVMEAGEEDEELPEKLIGTIALNKINVNAQYRYKLFSDFDKEDNTNGSGTSNQSYL